MRDFNDIIDEANGYQTRLLTEAFEAGRLAGRREAAADLRYKLGAVLADENGGQETLIGEGMAKLEAEKADEERRASPGSVKPVIAKLMTERPGLSVDEVTEITGFKKNSVRGTLWLLGQEGLVERRGRQWFPLDEKNEGDNANDATASEDEAVDDNPSPEPSTASVQPEAHGREAGPGGGG